MGKRGFWFVKALVHIVPVVVEANPYKVENTIGIAMWA
jgi:hypothetical protein